ncbi:MAG: hypothetical protein ACNI27_07280 [Desulfovibrio sp.]
MPTINLTTPIHWRGKTYAKGDEKALWDELKAVAKIRWGKNK